MCASMSWVILQSTNQYYISNKLLTGYIEMSANQIVRIKILLMTM